MLEEKETHCAICEKFVPGLMTPASSFSERTTTRPTFSLMRNSSSARLFNCFNNCQTQTAERRRVIQKTMEALISLSRNDNDARLTAISGVLVL
ncbi:hypothetical protein NPIL_588281 [Nephila pilipes]|uniref:Uncharacterized protein n=1 Tax=Nephila pilipes TaxID=299642 RepID=A0A8X6Q7U8_NEPPI|nr:hypothetical protein NPIL_588281 [Nephila pilipes]